MSETFLTLHIGGAHFSTGLFTQQTGKMVPQSYQRIPVSYKAGQDTLLKIWKDAITALPQAYLANLKGCAIAVPLPFIDEQARNIPACAERYAKLYATDLVEFFAEILKLQPEAVQLHYNGIAYLQGELVAQPQLDGVGTAGVYLGTDLSASIITNKGIGQLNWEIKPYLNKCANDYLSAQSLLREYYQETGISLINVKQLTELSKSNSSARHVLKDFIQRALNFLTAEIANNHIHTLVLGGDLVRYNPGMFQMLKAELPVKLVYWSNQDDTFHKGLFQLSQQPVGLQ